MISFNNLVETVPITEFVKLLKPNASDLLLKDVFRLRHRHQVYLFVTLNKDKITDDQWIYFPELRFKIGRISEMKNFSKEMSPDGKTSLFIEFFCFEEDLVWQMSKEDLLILALKELEVLGIKKEDVRNVYHIKQKNVYPVYDLNYQIHLQKIKNYLDGFENLFYIGRPGRFRYNNQDHSLEMGMLAAKCIIDGKRYDIESVGNEEEYYEKGSVPNKK